MTISKMYGTAVEFFQKKKKKQLEFKFLLYYI